jgi:hypothetical protein
MENWFRNNRLTVLGRFAVLVLVMDIAVAIALLAILRDPISVLVTFAILYACSIVPLRGKALVEPRDA